MATRGPAVTGVVCIAFRRRIRCPVVSEESPTPGEALGHAAARLTMFPNNLGAWWDLALALAAAEQNDVARKAYS